MVRLPRKLILGLSIALLVSCAAGTSGGASLSSQKEASSSVSSESASSEEGSSSSAASPEYSISSNSSEEASSGDVSSEASSSEEESSSEESSSSEEMSSGEESSQASSEEYSSQSSSEQSSGEESSSGETPDIWNMDLTRFGKEFQVTLAKKINDTRTKTTSYSNCLDAGIKAAAYPYENSQSFIPFYHEPKDGQQVTGTKGVNREHTWPNSRGSKKTGMGADPLVIRPTLSSDNSDRSNHFYGTGGKANLEWDPASCGYEAARGEAARIILYAATAYHAQGFVLTNNPKDDWTKIKSMGTLKTLLAWNRTYAPSQFEKAVCDRYDKMGYARNAFVDHPEYADYIYDDDGIRETPLD